jgi:hypothetical protein
MATARVALADARERRLPLVSVRSGKPANGYAAAGRAPYVVRVPLTQDEFDRVQWLELRRRSAIVGGVICVAFGVAMARFPVMLPLGLLIGALSFALWGACALMLRRLLPVVEPGPEAGQVTLRGVDRRFVAAVADVAD